MEMADTTYSLKRSDEDTRTRTVRYLRDAQNVEKSLVSQLESMSNELQDKDPQISQMFAQHRHVTIQQQDSLDARVRALGEEPGGGGGYFGGMMAKLGEFMHRPHDDYDQITQNLMKAYAVENFEMAMYQSLIAYANAVGDTETAILCRNIFAQEKQAAELVWSMIEPVAMRTAQVSGTLTTDQTYRQDIA